MKPTVHASVVKAFLNETQIYISDSPSRTGGYREPHLGVRYTVARFEYVRVYVISG